MSAFYITTAIEYANGEPHVGHAFEKIARRSPKVTAC